MLEPSSQRWNVQRMNPALRPAAVLTCMVLPACQPAPVPVPTEKTAVIRESIAPGLHEYENDAPSLRTLFRGDVVLIGKRWPTLRWQGLLEGSVEQREGAMLDIKVNEADSLRWVFAESVHDDVDVPTVAWLCEQMGNPSPDGLPCTSVLRRAVTTDGAVVAYATCSQVGCPIALVRDGRVRKTAVDGLSSFRLIESGSRTYALARNRWVKAPDLTGSSAIVFQISPVFCRLAEITVEEIDARSPDMVSTQLGEVRVSGSVIAYRGTRTSISRETGAPMSKPISLSHDFWLSPDGQFVGR